MTAPPFFYILAFMFFDKTKVRFKQNLPTLKGIGNIWIGRIVAVPKAQANRLIKLGYAEKYLENHPLAPAAKPGEKKKVVVILDKKPARRTAKKKGVKQDEPE